VDKLGNYKLDKAFSDGVSIYLDDAPDVEFKVKLPSQYNRAYTQALYGSLELTVDADGALSSGGNLMRTRFQQEDSFVEHCLLTMDGEPISGDFQATYPDAVTELMEKANELANTLSERVTDSAKKSSASSSGNASGQAKSVSMSASKVTAA